jgi:hypothetical protein
MNNKILKTIFYIFIVLFILAVIGFIVYYQVVEYYQQLDPMLKIIQETLHPLHEKVKTLAFFEGNKS